MNTPTLQDLIAMINDESVSDTEVADAAEAVGMHIIYGDAIDGDDDGSYIVPIHRNM